MNYIFTIVFFLTTVSSNLNPTSKTFEIPYPKAKVIAVKDGDTIEILTVDKFTIPIRLDGIDCPEKKQAFGQKAKQFTSDFCFGKYVFIKGTKRDGYGRLLAIIYDEKGTNLNELLLQNGLAWHYKQYSKSAILQSKEDQARTTRKGLWADANPIAPWDYRKRK